MALLASGSVVRRQTAWVLVPALSLGSCVALGGLLSLSVLETFSFTWKVTTSLRRWPCTLNGPWKELETVLTHVAPELQLLVF